MILKASAAFLFGLLAAIILLPIGCANSAFRTEQVTVDAAFTAYVGWTNYLAQAKVTPELLQASNHVKDARLKFAATATTANSLIREAQTNSAAQPQVDAILATLNDQKSNIVWLIEYYRQPALPFSPEK